MSTKQRVACDLITKISDNELPRVISILQIFACEGFATEEELEAIKRGEEEIANGECYTQEEVEKMFNIQK